MRINNAVSGVWHSISLCRWNFSDYIILCYFFPCCLLFLLLFVYFDASVCLCVHVHSVGADFAYSWFSINQTESALLRFYLSHAQRFHAMLHLFKISDAMRGLNILYFHSCYIDWPTWLSKVTTICMSINMKSTKSKTETFFFFSEKERNERTNFFSCFVNFPEFLRIPTDFLFLFLEIQQSWNSLGLKFVKESNLKHHH